MARLAVLDRQQHSIETVSAHREGFRLGLLALPAGVPQREGSITRAGADSTLLAVDGARLATSSSQGIVVST
jgi:hypothetical protein